ncbi:MAG: nucleoside phosphorylase [Candidatus Heimdallarchaeota archaeon]|nr:nucleoside phosphorylase [Candidatus Heimdallarchaeota archaeon]
MLQPHIKLEEVDKYCILSGNPDRVPIIGSYLKECTKVAEYRGLVAMKGFTPEQGVAVTILTTGMGTGSSGIVIEEAFRAGARNFLRVGSTGALQNHTGMGIGSIYIPFGAIQDEKSSELLVPPEVPAIAHPTLFQALSESSEKLGVPYHTGLVWTSDIYYQEDPNYYKKWIKYGATCVEMESSMLYRFCANKGYEAKGGTILTADGNLNETKSIYIGDTRKNQDLFDKGVENTIKITIAAIEQLN